MALVTFKVRHYDKSVSKRVFSKVKGKEISQMVGQRVMEDVIAGTAPKIARKAKYSAIVQNKRVVMETAIYFHRVVARTPKDEYYYNSYRERYHSPDNDYVWKSWTIKSLGGRRVGITAGELGEQLFEIFNDLSAISTIYNLIMKSLGDEFFKEKRKKKVGVISKVRRLKTVKVENTHARYAQLEYGGYKCNEAPIKEGPKYQHGIVHGYSVQAPYGMERITRAEMACVLGRYVTTNSFVIK